MASRLAWLGLGNMGKAMATNLASKGTLEHPLLLWNRTMSRAESLANAVGKEYAIAVPTIAEAVAAADIVFLCLSNDLAVEETMSQALRGDVTDKIFVDSSTIHPDATENMAREAERKGAQFISITVMGSPAVASAGELICIASGPSTALDLVLPYTTGVIARQAIVFRDERAGQADLLKLIANIFILNVNEVVAEGLTLAEKASVAPQKLQELIVALFGGVYRTYAERMMSGNYYKAPVPVPVTMALKDAYHAQRIAEAVGVHLPSLENVIQQLTVVQKQHGPGADSSGVYGVRRSESGLPFEN